MVRHLGWNATGAGGVEDITRRPGRLVYSGHLGYRYTIHAYSVEQTLWKSMLDYIRRPIRPRVWATTPAWHLCGWQRLRMVHQK